MKEPALKEPAFLIIQKLAPFLMSDTKVRLYH